MALLPPETLAQGVYTASAGNMAQGVAWNARRLGVPCTVVVPEHAPQTKIAAVERLGASIVRLPFDAWWNVIIEHHHPGIEGVFIHPVSDPAVIAGNGTIGLEILEDLPDVGAVVVPFGGGGLSCGIGAAIRALSPGVKIFAAEVATAAPLSASLAAGAPRKVDYTPSFVDGIGATGVLEEMWPLGLHPARRIVRRLASRRPPRRSSSWSSAIASSPRARAPHRSRPRSRGKAGGGKIVCVVSGGNIDAGKLAAILGGELPVSHYGQVVEVRGVRSFCVP